MLTLTTRDLLDYEINAARWWVGHVSSRWLQNKIASYFAWKVKRKYAAYQKGMFIRALFERREAWERKTSGKPSE